VDSRVVRRAQTRANHTADVRTERRDGRAYKRQVLRAGTADRFSARKLSDREDYPFATFGGSAIRKNSIAGSTRSTTSVKTVAAAAAAARECKSEPQILEVLTVCQIVSSFLIVIVSLLNLSLSDRDKALWSTLVGADFGYLVPNPRFKRIGGGSNDESIHYLVAQQQLDGPLPEQQGVAMEDESE